jgi:hypothetical protein
MHHVPMVRFLGSESSMADRRNLFDYFIYIFFFIYVIFFDYVH